MNDTFRGDTPHLISSIEALLSLDAAGALVPHGIGGHARGLLESAAARLATPVVVTEDMHVAAVKVLQRATGLDGLPQRMLDAMLAVAPLAAPAEAAELSPEFTDTARAALLWVLWHHQGASSKVGQPIRFALGMGQYDRLNDHQISEAKRWESIPVDAPVQQAGDKGGMTILEALRQGIRAEPWVSNGPGAMACVGLCGIQLEGWSHTAESAKAFADAYNLGLDHMRAALKGEQPAQPSDSERGREQPDDTPLETGEGDAR